ncbi:pentapeptide repeat-containing protein [Chamaesiphon sp. VAR_48_metabat_403]|uniref:pentapeptide repeat-containing protein n=1 Tax=Chamaesiphon sp. VAR_48_metabat_403 TaxID=2964700 RepID=UPI00286E66FF|nr:pentapeptide repeat-containing protein [Chamaesiphon sp. VAR_48_metabat_403]
MNDSDNAAAAAGFADRFSSGEATPTSDNNLPDFTTNGYRVETRLSERNERGVATYLAREIDLDSPEATLRGRSVVIKQWQMSRQIGVNEDYANYLPAIERLQQLNHLNIACYLNSFETPTGFCVVREYHPGVSLAELGTLPPADIKLVADVVLKILKDLHQLEPIVVHQNIKPENIIVNTETELEIYLVDFSLHPHSDLVGGKPAPLENRLQSSPSSDLYSLGMSLICMLTGTSTSQAQHLFDLNYRLNFRHLLPATIDPKLIAWLERMVESNYRPEHLNVFTVKRSTPKIVPEEQPEKLGFKLPEPKRRTNWWGWVIGIGLLVGTGIFARPFLFQESDELTPAQIAKNNSFVKEAEFAASDRGKLLKDKRCLSCNLDGQDFSRLDLAGAVVPQSSFKGTNFTGTNLKLAIFQDADLNGANFSKANLQQAALYGAKIISVNLAGANLTNGKLVYASFKGSVLRDANLSNADLKFAELQQVDLRGANLTGADLSNADLTNANLQNAILDGAKLDNTNLTGTTMPDGSVHP